MPHRNGHALAPSRLQQQALALPRILSEAVQKRTSNSEAAAGVQRINMMIVNAYLVGDKGAPDRSWALVDAGMSIGVPGIIAAAAERFGRDSRPGAIILTHGHFDHVGGLPQLADYWDAPIYAHTLELPYITGRSPYPPPDPAAGGGSMTLLSRFFPRGPFNFGQRVRTLPSDGSLPGMTGWRWIATPGHSPGHVSLFREADRMLIVGDAFVCTRQESALSVLMQRPEVRRPPGYYTPDWGSARSSVARLAELRPEVAATGHGPVMRGEELRRGLEALLDSWDEVAVPKAGRYSNEAAITDSEGVQHIPPPSRAANMQTVVGLGLAALVAGALINRRRDR